MDELLPKYYCDDCDTTFLMWLDRIWKYPYCPNCGSKIKVNFIGSVKVSALDVSEEKAGE